MTTSESIPLPLVDGALWIDNSFLEDLQACPRLCEYRDCRKRTLAVERSALNFGSAAHRWLKYRYRFAEEGPNSHAIEIMERLIQGHFRSKPNALDDYRQPDLAIRLMQRYNQIYMVEPWHVVCTKRGPFVEFPFAIRLCDLGWYPDYANNKMVTLPVMYCGRIDLAIEQDGEVYVVDHKTTSMLGPTFFEDQGMSAQQRGYVWAFWKATGILPKGYIINAIRVRRPATSDRAKKAQVEDDDFERCRYYLDSDGLSEWERNVRALIEEFLWHHGRGYMPMKTKWCVGKYGRCSYYDVCSLPANNREQMLASGLFEDNKWSPLNH